MKPPEWPCGCWPNPTQRLLIQACVLPDDGAAEQAWRGWEARTALDTLDAGSFKLLPVLYRRLEAWGVRSRHAERVRGVSRWCWIRHKLLMGELNRVVALLDRHAIRTLLLKGAALNGTAYPPGVRAMEDIDVLVERPAAPQALRLLSENGWRPLFDMPPEQMAVTHSVPLRLAGSQAELDLHWDFCHGRFLSPAEQRGLWERGIPAPGQPESCRLLCPTDQLLHTCEHGARYNPTPPLRWLVDAAMVLRADGRRINWPGLAATAQALGMVLPLRGTLRFLTEHAGVQLPDGARHALRGVHATIAQWIEHRLATRRPRGSHPFWQTLPGELCCYFRARRTNPTLRLADYLRLANNLSEPATTHAWRLCRVGAAEWVAACKRRLGLGGGELSFASAAEESLQGFYPPELYGGTLFRWSMPAAAITLPLARRPSPDAAEGPARGEIQLAPFRDADSLADSLRLRLNRAWLPLEDCRLAGDRLEFVLRPEHFVDRPHQRLELQCTPWDAAEGDPRRLGVPVIGFRISTAA
ncbi:MAG: nucleotidyltransferase family protein [Planctomycetota bacterium]